VRLDSPYLHAPTNSFHTHNAYKCHRMPREHPTVQKSQLPAHRSVEFRTSVFQRQLCLSCSKSSEKSGSATRAVPLHAQLFDEKLVVTTFCLQKWGALAIGSYNVLLTKTRGPCQLFEVQYILGLVRKVTPLCCIKQAEWACCDWSRPVKLGLVCCVCDKVVCMCTYAAADFIVRVVKCAQW
jgi:hypothetical protein